MKQIRIWHDDVHPNPEGWIWAQNNDTVKRLYRRHKVIEISLDHDLAIQTGLDLVEWMVQTNNVPPKVTIHSWNPVGARRMAECLRTAGHDPLVKPHNTNKP